MAKRTEVEEEVVENEVIYYECDKCYGHFHDETTREEDLKKVVFGAYPSQTMTNHVPVANGVNAFNNNDIRIKGEYEYLLCEHCMEDARDYLEDYF